MNPRKLLAPLIVSSVANVVALTHSVTEPLFSGIMGLMTCLFFAKSLWRSYQVCAKPDNKKSWGKCWLCLVA
ncbi:hypothetical protein CYJ27_03665 [Aerococcus christensenii]|uniref:Uncharacterized protein n=1 Tax=Aerococcus christensenii TaxID=87541 RepID=A0A2I1K835_9LACT|nr:hypothetical protein [Aerococcus christensenii]PKY91778.1 hypothetical protein CYJ27_03665 [Aerococcus christensenii]